MAFFRVFDLAFFAPGGLLVCALAMSGWLPARVTDGTSSQVFAVIGAIVSTYVLGVWCHGVQSSIMKVVKIERRHVAAETTSQPWYSELEKPALDELAHYFWYLRATCRNLAVASLLAGLIIAASNTHAATQLFGGLVTACGPVFFCMLGNDYERGLRRAIHSKASSRRVVASGMAGRSDDPIQNGGASAQR